MTDPLKTAPRPTTPKTTTPTPTTPPPTTKAAQPPDDKDVEDIGALKTARPTSTAAAEAVRAVDAELSGLVIFDGDAASAVDNLDALSPGDARAALTTLAGSGKLDVLADQVPPAAREKLVDVMIRSGFVGSEAGSMNGPARTTGPQPPDPPLFAAHKSELSPAMNKMVRAENLARLDRFSDEIKTYRADYQQAVRDVTTNAELRALGPIAEPRLPTWEPGTRHVNDDHDWSAKSQPAPDVETGRIVTDKLFRLQGRSPPGTDFAFDATVRVGLAHLVSASVKGSVKEDRSGVKSTSVSTELKGSVGPEGLHAQITGGASATTVNGKTTVAKTPVTVGINDANKGPEAHEFDDTGLGVSVGKDSAALNVKSDGAGVALKATKTAASLEVSGGGAKAGVNYDTTKDAQGRERSTLTGTLGAGPATFKGGVDSDGGVVMGGGLTQELGSKTGLNGTLSVSGEIRTQVMSTADYAAAFANIEGDAFSTPPELARGKKWQDLNASQQGAYELLGWGKSEWESEQKKSLDLSTARMGRR